MSTTITATTDAPGVTARLRLPRHHVAARNQSITDALELVRRLEGLIEVQTSAGEIAPPDVFEIEDVAVPNGTPPVRNPPRAGHCRCEWGGAWSPDDAAARAVDEHDRLIERLSSTEPWVVADMVEEAMVWEELFDGGAGGIGPSCWPRFVAQHNWPDAVATQKLVNAIRMARMAMRAWHAATAEQRAQWDLDEDV